MSTTLPPEGLVRTVTAMPGKEEGVPAGRLWLLRHKSEQGPPILLPPESNTHNRWTFDRRGHLVSDLNWASSLVSVPAEGFYRLKRDVTLDDGRTISKNQLLQVGYNRSGSAIIFFPRPDTTLGNHLLFPDKGMMATPSVLSALDPLDLRGPRPAQS